MGWKCRLLGHKWGYTIEKSYKSHKLTKKRALRKCERCGHSEIWIAGKWFSADNEVALALAEYREEFSHGRR